MSTIAITKHTIRVESLPRFEALVAEHNKKIAKLNKRHGATLAPMFFTVTATREITAEEVKASVEANDQDAAVRTYAAGTIVADINLSGERPILAGWAIVGVLTATDEGYLVSRVRDAAYADVEPFAKRGGDCDHCKASRRRSTTYLLRSNEASMSNPQLPPAIKVIGSTCLKDFTGHASPALLVAYADYSVCFDAELAELDEDEGDRSYGGGGGGPQRAVALAKFLGYVRAIIRQFGWVAKSRAYETGERATATRAWDELCQVAQLEHAKITNPSHMELYEAQIAKMVPTPTDIEMATADLALVDDTFSANTNNDDFQTNTLAVVRQGYAFGRNLGLAAAITRAADRIRGDVAKRTERATQVDEHFGTVGKRETWRLKCVYTTDIQGGFGVTQLCLFRDKDGRSAKWFNSSRTTLDRGTTYDVKGTVKKHDIYEGKRITMLSRCTISEVKDEAVASAEATVAAAEAAS